MIDAALLGTCSDPSLAPAIVEQFVKAVGSDDPLAITVTVGSRLLLVPKPRSPDEALDIVRQHVGSANVRVGLTQIPADIGITDATQLDAGLVDACKNLKMGTSTFAKIARIVTRWYGSPTAEEVLPQMIDDAIYAWKSGLFEGVDVFRAKDPGGRTFLSGNASVGHSEHNAKGALTETVDEKAGARDANQAGMRIDISRINGND